jgi:hypothetical protein
LVAVKHSLKATVLAKAIVQKQVGLELKREIRTLVEGCNGGDMPKGTTVVEGRYWNQVPRSPHWFQEGTWDDHILLFRVQYILDPNIKMEAYHQRDGNLTMANSLTDEQRRRAPTTCKKVPASVVEDIKLEKKRRNELDHVEVEFKDNTSNDEDDPEEEDKEEEDEEEE